MLLRKLSILRLRWAPMVRLGKVTSHRRTAPLRGAPTPNHSASPPSITPKATLLRYQQALSISILTGQASCEKVNPCQPSHTPQACSPQAK
jgi:hypothetical protein